MQYKILIFNQLGNDSWTLNILMLKIATCILYKIRYLIISMFCVIVNKEENLRKNCFTRENVTRQQA